MRLLFFPLFKHCTAFRPLRDTRLILRSSWIYRIYDNQHLLDATEIFRKLNVHKKVKLFCKPAQSESDADGRLRNHSSSSASTC